MHRVFIAGCSREQTDEFYQAIFEQVLRNISAFVVDQATGNIGPEKESTKKQEQKSTHSARNLQKPNMKGTAVRQIQEALAALYFYPDKGAKNNGIDVYYGTKTKAQLESLLV
ncbi:N-acetylmuramoyl-L-alanine amidase CwlA [Bacillus licheniformis]|nr:N-acetylmuramoyl-L-alanine amidase CwlA [Bacillus licheniformis]